MPTYAYKSLSDEETIYEFFQSIHDAPLTHHPENGEQITRIITSAAYIRLPGIKKSAKVDKKSPAATACGCASQAVLQSLGMQKQTPRYSATKPTAHSHGHAHGHSHSHSHAGHGHKHGAHCAGKH